MRGRATNLPQTESSLTKLLWKNHAFALGATCNGDGKLHLLGNLEGLRTLRLVVGQALLCVVCLYLILCVLYICLFASRNMCSRGAQHKRPAGFSGPSNLTKSGCAHYSVVCFGT